MEKKKYKVKKITELPKVEGGTPVVLAEENNELKQFDLSELQASGSGMYLNKITSGDIDGENCRFFVTRDMARNKSFVYLNGVKQTIGKDYFHRPNPKELVFSYAPYADADLRIYSN